MTQIGTFWEGLILVGVGIVMTILASVFKVDFGSTSTTLITLGVGYIGGGAAGQVQAQKAADAPSPKTP